MKESYGDLEQLNELGKHKQNSFTIEQMLNEHLKNVGVLIDEVVQFK